MKELLSFILSSVFFFCSRVSCSHCSLGQYWDMSASLPGTWTGTDTPGEIKPVAWQTLRKYLGLCNLRAFLKKKNYPSKFYNICISVFCFGRRVNAYPLRLCLRWPLIGCSYVPACAVVCMCHSSAHSPKD